MSNLKDLKSIIQKTLEKEGGAAGLKALKKAVKKSDMPTKGLDKKLNKMSGVKQHQDGDYISTPLTEIKDIIEVMIEGLSSDLNEKKKKKKDRCHRKADSVYGTKTSAYKSGAIVKCRKGMIWKKKNESIDEDALELSKKNMTMYGAKKEQRRPLAKSSTFNKRSIFQTESSQNELKSKTNRPAKKYTGDTELVLEYDVVNEEDTKDFVAFMRENYLESDLTEAEYKGRKVKLGKIMRGDVKKFKVYVKNPKGNVVKVNFGQKGMNIKKNNPKRRKAFRARHRCDNPGPRHKARYWACRTW